MLIEFLEFREVWGDGNLVVIEIIVEMVKERVWEKDFEWSFEVF